MRNWSRARELVVQFAAGEGTGPEGYELLQLVFEGFPVRELEPLVRSEDVDAARLAAGIFAEAGRSSIDVPELIDELLDHADAKVRYYGVQTVLGSGSPALARQTATSVLLLDDVDSAVQRSALRLLAHAPADQLLAAVPFLDNSWGTRILALLSDARPSGPIAHLKVDWEGDRVASLCLVAAAIRNASVDPGPLQHFATHADPDIRELVQRELDQLQRRRG
jgi:hypothetical protein